MDSTTEAGTAHRLISVGPISESCVSLTRVDRAACHADTSRRPLSKGRRPSHRSAVLGPAKMLNAVMPYHADPMTVPPETMDSSSMGDTRL